MTKCLLVYQHYFWLQLKLWLLCFVATSRKPPRNSKPMNLNSNQEYLKETGSSGILAHTVIVTNSLQQSSPPTVTHTSNTLHSPRAVPIKSASHSGSSSMHSSRIVDGDTAATPPAIHAHSSTDQVLLHN